jgi:hypothetical protein
LEVEASDELLEIVHRFVGDAEKLASDLTSLGRSNPGLLNLE